MKVIYSGLESSGKSLKLAMVTADLLHRNAKWRVASGISRPIASNLRFSPWFHALAKEQGIEIIYWENLDDLIALRDVDVIMDEVGVYFDSRVWQDLSLDVRRWLSQGAKMGIEIYGTSQDFAQVDLSFRRLVNNLYYIRKVAGSDRPSATRPPVNKIWGVCLMNELDPRTYKEDEDKFAGTSIFSYRFFTIQRKYCEIFDTTQMIKKSRPPLYKHIERVCEKHGIKGDSCDFHRVVHV